MNFITHTLKEKIIQSCCLVYEIKTDGNYKIFFEDKNLFNFSDYPQDSKFLVYLIKQ